MANSKKMVVSPLELAKSYFGGLSHTHTVLSNHKGHRESDLSVDKIVEVLSEAGLVRGVNPPLEFILFNEHPSDPGKPKRLGILSRRARRLLRQRRRPFVRTVPMLYGLEVSILRDGSTDLSPRLSDKSSLVIASRHKLPLSIERDPESIKKMFTSACQNPAVGVLGHPARYIENIELDWANLFAQAAQTGTGIEINYNSFPDFYDFEDRKEFWVKWLKQLGESDATVFIGSDVHTLLQLERFCSDWNNLADPDMQNNGLARFVVAIAEAGIKPERVINANKDIFFHWLSLDKPNRAKLCLVNQKNKVE